ncbi:tripartite tricarboxylate transporter substrate binding protein [Ramlibacter sp. AN1015]|uniref:tripartite tricarboxylate transporter substrate binding protein n=1 Tax=Ramlibacter sp. AN1015 TaxID=3133428 RepID=UPI0030C261AB
MNYSFKRRTFVAGLAAAAAVPGAWSQPAWPSRPIQLVHGFGAGGNADVIARLVAQHLGEQLGQSVVVDIKSGAGGMLASSHVAKSAPDGHTLVLLTGAHTASAAMRASLPYDPVKDFSFISTVTAFPFAVCVRAEHPAKTLADLIKIARTGSDKVSFTSVGVGSTQHLTGELLGGAAGVQLLHVPYRGGGAPVQSVLAGEVDLLCDTLTVSLPHIQSGRLRALAVTSATPWPSLPNVPPAAVTLPGFEVKSWLGVAGPAGLPPEIVQRLHAELGTLLQNPQVQRTVANAGSATAHITPQAMRDMVQSDIARWRDVIARRGIQIQS